MKRAIVGFLSVLFVLSMLPMASAQAGKQVAACSEECDPMAINGGQVKTGTDSVKTILYAHFEDILNRAPLNTQPLSEKEPIINRGFIMPVLSTTTGTDADFHFENNWFTMFSSAGLVEIGEDQSRRSHQEPGLAEDLHIVEGQPINLYFYLSAYPVPNSDSSSGTPALDVMPQVGIFARMETGRHAFKGDLIAQGDTGADDTAGLIGGAGRVNMITQPGSPDIYEFKVPLKVEKTTIPSVLTTQGFLVSINPYQVKVKEGQPALAGSQVMQNDWRVRIGPTTPPRLVIDVVNPMVTKTASLSLFDENMYVRWSFISPWGSYDLDQDVLTTGKAIKIEGPKAVDAGLIRLVNIKFSKDHDGHFKPVNVTWRFDYKKAALADGDYAVKLNVLNLQRTYQLQETLTFKVAGGVPQDLKVIGNDPAAKAQAAPKKAEDKGLLPGFEVPALAAALAVGALGLRRRKA